MLLLICSASWQFPPRASGRGEPQSQHQELQVICISVIASPVALCLVYVSLVAAISLSLSASRAHVRVCFHCESQMAFLLEQVMTGLSFSIFIIYFCDVLYVDIISIVIVDKLHMRIKACTSHCVYICCINSSSATYLPFGS